MLKGGYEIEKRETPFGTFVDHENRASLAQQAKRLLTGKDKWSPTWKSLPADVRVMQGQVDPPQSTPSEAAQR